MDMEEIPEYEDYRKKLLENARRNANLDRDEKIETKDLDFFRKNQQYLNCLPTEVSEFIDINKIIGIIDKDEYIDVFWDYLNSFVKLSIKYESAP